MEASQVSQARTSSSLSQTDEVTFLKTKMSDRQAVKALGARWNPTRRLWYVPAGMDLEPFNAWLPSRQAQHLQSQQHQSDALPSGQSTCATEKVYLTTLFHEKDTVKKLGARWDADKRHWYVPVGHDVEPFLQWLQDSTPYDATTTPPAPPSQPQSPLQHQDDGGFATEDTELNCRDNERHQVEALGAHWNPERKKWVAPAGSDLRAFRQWLGPKTSEAASTAATTGGDKRTNIVCDFEENDRVKALGGRWDCDARM